MFSVLSMSSLFLNLLSSVAALWGCWCVSALYLSACRRLGSLDGHKTMVTWPHPWGHTMQDHSPTCPASVFDFINHIMAHPNTRLCYMSLIKGFALFLTLSEWSAFLSCPSRVPPNQCISSSCDLTSLRKVEKLWLVFFILSFWWPHTFLQLSKVWCLQLKTLFQELVFLWHTPCPQSVIHTGVKGFDLPGKLLSKKRSSVSLINFIFYIFFSSTWWQLFCYRTQINVFLLQ